MPLLFTATTKTIRTLPKKFLLQFKAAAGQQKSLRFFLIVEHTHTQKQRAAYTYAAIHARMQRIYNELQTCFKRSSSSASEMARLTAGTRQGSSRPNELLKFAFALSFLRYVS